jgi:Leucine-rich repeat (LRR) protein
MRALQILNVSHNKITKFPEEIKSCTRLQVIDVSYNNLFMQAIPHLALLLPELQSLIVEGNPHAEGRMQKRQRT